MTERITFPPSSFERAILQSDMEHEESWGRPGHVSVRPGGTWKHLWLDEHRISLKKSDHQVGISKSGKRFSRYTPHSQITFNFKPRLRVFYSYRDKRRGKVIYDITANSRGMGTDREITAHLLERAPFLSVPQEVDRDYRNYRGLGGALHLNVWIWQRIAYPVLREAPHWNSVIGLSPALRQTNLQDFVRTAFGSTRYRKDLVKAIASAPTLQGTWIAHELMTTFPIDWLIPIVGSTHQVSDVRQIKGFMRWLPESSAKRLLHDLRGDGLRHYDVADALRSWSQIMRLDPTYTLGDYRFVNWLEAHDHLSRELGKMEQADREIEVTKLGKKLNGKSRDGLTLVHPRSTHELIDWGRDMHNCIGGYSHAAMAGSSVLFAVMRGDRMIGNMELTPSGSVRQLVGDYNRPLPIEIQETIYEMVGQTPTRRNEVGDFPF